MCSARAVPLILLLVLALGCGGGGRRLFQEYEYEEDIYLDIDGSATVFVNTSVAALVALRGFDLDPRPRARLDRAKLRTLYESPVTTVTRVSQPWRRHGRRFVQIRVEVEDVRQLGRAAPFGWSDYRFDRKDELYVYRQAVVGPAARELEDVGWTGEELIAFRLHLPSRIEYHNAPSKTVERGNIVSWEQSLKDRLAGTPLQIEVRMETQSILYNTLWLFAMAFGTAMSVLGALIWWVVKKKDVEES